MTDKEIYCTAIMKYGTFQQELVAVEECSELIQAIIHKHRGRPHNLAEEIADVEIMLEQLKLINDCCEEVEQKKRFKIARLLCRLKGGAV